MYGILEKSTGILLGYTVSANPEDSDCNLLAYELEIRSGRFGIDIPVWLVKDRYIAEKAAVTNTPWFNADYEHPQNRYNSDKLQVVEVELIIHK